MFAGLTSREHTGEDTSQQILNNISNTMTDRHVVNQKTNKQIPDLNTNNKENFGKKLCGVHPLDTFAKVSDKVLRKAEQDRGAVNSKSFVPRCHSQAPSSIHYFRSGEILPQEGGWLSGRDKGIPGNATSRKESGRVSCRPAIPHIVQKWRCHLPLEVSDSGLYLKSMG